jgi:hypothetical protein
LISDVRLRGHIRDSLRFASVKFGYVIASYTRMAGFRCDPELSALGGAFGRLYDDLVDNGDERMLDDRLAALFHGGAFTASTDLERLLEEIYHTIDAALSRPRSDPIYATLIALHEYESLSRRQRDPAISRAALGKISRGKGGLGTVALFALMRPNMGTFERELIMEVGEVCQMIDDYVDHAVDRRNGIITAMTCGETDLSDVGERLRTVHSRLLEFYGGAGARQFVGVLYLMLVLGFCARRGLFWVSPRPGSWRRIRKPMLILMSRGESVFPGRN